MPKLRTSEAELAEQHENVYAFTVFSMDGETAGCLMHDALEAHRMRRELKAFLGNDDRPGCRLSTIARLMAILDGAT